MWLTPLKIRVKPASWPHMRLQLSPHITGTTDIPIAKIIARSGSDTQSPVIILSVFYENAFLDGKSLSGVQVVRPSPASVASYNDNQALSADGSQLIPCPETQSGSVCPIPNQTQLSSVICICAVGTFGLVYIGSLIVLESEFYEKHSDRYRYAVVPFLAYLVLFIGGLLLRPRWPSRSGSGGRRNGHVTELRNPKLVVNSDIDPGVAELRTAAQAIPASANSTLPRCCEGAGLIEDNLFGVERWLAEAVAGDNGTLLPDK